MTSPVAIGIDVVDVAKFKKLYLELEPASLERVFAPSELVDVGTEGDQARRLAARLAAKEATFKALGGLQDGMAWTDVVVRRLENGAPTLALSGGALTKARQLGINAWLVSLSHLEVVAVASVVALGGGPR